MDDLEGLKKSLKDVEIIATDVDDTLTINGLLTSDVIKAIEYINSTGRKVILVTGRSGGACTTLSQYLPVDMVIAENGGVIISNHEITTMNLPGDHLARLDRCFEDIKQLFPGMRQAQDNPFRLTDRSIDNRSIPEHAIEKMSAVAQSYRLTLTVSSVQTHILSPFCSKAGTLKSITRDRKTITVGDSANDETMFNPELFPLSIGVSNIKYYLNKLKYKPRWIMSEEQGYGFMELIDILKSTVY